MVAISNFENRNAIPKHIHCLPLFFLLLISSASSLTFNFPSFDSSDTNSSIYLEGDADINGGSIQLIKTTEKSMYAGRATFLEPFLLRQTSTGKLADFTSNFTFVINSSNSSYYADGLTFFLAPVGSLNYNTLTQGIGSNLGLPIGYSFSAVEFDIFNTSGVDPVEGPHIGIDLNSLISEVAEPWDGGIMFGRPNNANISYDSRSKNLSVAFTSLDDDGRNIIIKYLSYIVNLSDHLPDSVIVGFSAGRGGYTAQHTIKSWSFNSTALMSADNVPALPAPKPSNEEKSKSGNGNSRLVVGLAVGGCILLVFGVVLCWYFFWRNRGSSTEENAKALDDEFEKGTGPRKFSYSELARATSDFAEGQRLGAGGFGGVYRGFTKEMNLTVAVKKISDGSRQGLKEYEAEVKIISRLRHRNLVQLIGWCHEKGQLLLVYEFMPNGSLDMHLFKGRSLLAWDIRYRIVQNLASGLLYLHEEWDQYVLHRDIKSSNVMLDSNFNAKLGDFGLARLVDHGEQMQTTDVAGTKGYMSPEYIETHKASKGSDVYSFGIVALEIACGRKPVDNNLRTNQVMVDWVRELYARGEVTEAADPKLRGFFDKKQMECLMTVGLWCSHSNHLSRPTIGAAIRVLNFHDSLPTLSLVLPEATSSSPAPPSSSSTGASGRGNTESSSIS